MRSKVFIIILLSALLPSAVFGAEISVTVSAYTSKAGALTATGTRPKPGTIAVSRDLLQSALPHGSCVQIPKMYGGSVFRVEDTMAKRWAKKIDIWVGSLEEAREKVGVRKEVAIKQVPCPSGSEERGQSGGAPGALFDPEHGVWIPEPFGAACPTDITGDNITDISDLVRVGVRFGESSTYPGWIPEDIHKDGIINILDIVLVAREFGNRCEGAEA
ncbi:MAG: hypothetical protein AAB634_02575, partial [Patescibacteria group bacterium]